MFAENECFCRTRGFNCEQGRKCPHRIPESMPKTAPRLPRQHYRPDRTSPPLAFIFVAIVAVLCAVAIVNIATRVTL